jgi:hypothetical protein
MWVRGAPCLALLYLLATLAQAAAWDTYDVGTIPFPGERANNKSPWSWFAVPPAFPSSHMIGLRTRRLWGRRLDRRGAAADASLSTEQHLAAFARSVPNAVCQQLPSSVRHHLNPLQHSGRLRRIPRQHVPRQHHSKPPAAGHHLTRSMPHA